MPVENLVVRHRDVLAKRHYVVSPNHVRYWASFSPNKVRKYEKRGAFCFVIVGEPSRAGDFYAIPHSAIASLLTDGNLYRSPGGKGRSWKMHTQAVGGHSFVFELNDDDSRPRPTFDASAYYGNAAPLGLVEIGAPAEQARQPIRATDAQGRQLDPRRRTAVEAYAMDLAKRAYPNAEDTSKTEPFDLRWRDADLEVRVEVKGTLGTGDHVLVTANEIENAHGARWRTDLFVVSEIQLEERDGVLRAHGGVARTITPWKPAAHDLTPTQYRCRVPRSSPRSARAPRR